MQSASLETIDGDSHIVKRLLTGVNEGEFITRYGDTGEDNFDESSGTIPQRLLMMNGKVVREATKPELFNASMRIASQAPTDRKAVETTYLAVLTRRPTPDEAAHFESRLAGIGGDERGRRVADLYWTLLNASEFSWNH